MTEINLSPNEVILLLIMAVVYNLPLLIGGSFAASALVGFGYLLGRAKR